MGLAIQFGRMSLNVIHDVLFDCDRKISQDREGAHNASFHGMFGRDFLLRVAKMVGRAFQSGMGYRRVGVLWLRGGGRAGSCLVEPCTRIPRKGTEQATM